MKSLSTPKADVTPGVAQFTPGPWDLRMLSDGLEEAPAGLTAEQRERWSALMSERNRPMRDNDGAFIVIAGNNFKKQTPSLLYGDT